MKLALPLAALLLLPPAANAQGNPGPFGGLFGREPQRTGTDFTGFDLRGSGGVQWDDALLDDAAGQDQRVSAGRVGTAAASAIFQRYTDRLKLLLRSNTEYRQSIEARPVGGVSVDEGLMVSFRPATKLSIDGNASYAYSPFFQFHPSFITLDSGRVMAGLPYVASVIDNHSASLTAGFTSYYSKRSTLGASVTRQEARFSRGRQAPLSMTGFYGLWTNQLNRDFQLRLGYRRDEWQQDLSRAGEYRQEELEAGVNFTRTFSVWRETSLSFATQTMFLRRAGEDRRFRLNGNVTLHKRMKRTWDVAVAGNRQTEFLPGFLAPLFADSLTASVTGRLSERVDTSTYISGARGEFGFDAALGRFTSASAVTLLNVAITRRFGWFGQAGFYHYDMPAGVASPVAMSRMTRRTFMTGISTWIPVYRRERVDRDSGEAVLAGNRS